MASCGKVFALTLFALSWLSWFIMLGGVAGMQAKCGGYLGHAVNIKIGTQDLTTFEEGCDTTNTTAFIWWSTWFEFFMLILLSIAECGRVKGLFLTKQLFLAMVSVCMMLAADRANVVISTYEGALRTSARVCMAGQVITLVCNLIMLLHFGGELAEMRSVRGDGGMERSDASPITADMQSVQLGSVSSMQPGPTFRIGDSMMSSGPNANPFAQPVGGSYANQYEEEFNRLVAVGSAGMTVPPAAPESKSAQKNSKAAAVALGTGSWQA